MSVLADNIGASVRTVREEVAELLGVSPDDVDPDADLIASGLDSIRMMSLSGRWRKQGIDVNFAALAENPTVAAWSALVEQRSEDDDRWSSATRSTTADDAGDPFPLAPMQHAMWLGRNDDQQLGGVAAHLYVEFDGAGVDPEPPARRGSETGCAPPDVARGDPARRYPADRRPRPSRHGLRPARAGRRSR